MRTELYLRRSFSLQVKDGLGHETEGRSSRKMLK